MKTYITVGGDEFAALDPDDLVRQMHAASHTPAESDEAWMEEAAARAKLQSGATISTRSPLDFVVTMIDAGLLKEAKGEA